MIYIQIADEMEPVAAECSSALDVATVLEQAAEYALRYVDAALNAEVTVVVSDDAQLHELNRQFLEVDAPTDVLSFPGGDVDPDSGVLYLGDVIISLPRAQAQAAAGGHPLEAELQLLVVHGMLHLLGYDHAEPDEKAAMWSLQAEILTSLGSAVTGPRND